MGATGTDTGGSIRQPASFWRIGRGEADLWPLLALGVVHSRRRWITRDRSPGRCGTPRSLLGSMAGHDEMDSTSADVAVPDFEAACGPLDKDFRIGVPKEYRSERHVPEIEPLWRQAEVLLREAGAESSRFSYRTRNMVCPPTTIIAPAEASSISPVMTVSVLACALTARTFEILYESTRGRRVRRRGEAADHDWHLCVVGWLLRCLLTCGHRKSGALILRDFTEVFEIVDATVDADRSVGRVRAGREDG